MNNPFEEIFKRLENIEKMIAPFTGVQPEERQDGKEPVLVKISVASGITGYSVNYLYHLASKGLIPEDPLINTPFKPFLTRSLAYASIGS